MNLPPSASQPLPVADVHVVMNALNRLAARAMAQGREEDPLLFALADYLRTTLASSSSLRLPLAQEGEALASLLELEREISGARTELHAQAPWPALLVPRGILLAPATALLRARQPKSEGRWRLDLAWSRDGAHWVLALALVGLSAGAGCDGAAALALVQPALAGLGEGLGLSLQAQAGAPPCLRLALAPGMVAAVQG